MIHTYPTLDATDHDVLEMIRGLRSELKYQVSVNPIRWTGFLRRNTFARALQGSNSIEGINANLAEAVAIVDDERPETLEEETIRALNGYRTAMTYVLRLHDDPHLEINAQLIRSLHYMMLNYDMTKWPGQWRNGAIYVVHEPSKDTVYEGPDAELVPGLIDELVAQANSLPAVDSSMVLGAMVHLNLAMIHPFKDGNGRMARALQTLILARKGVVAPVFCSIEEWLGRNTDAYYKILAETAQGKWNPGNDATPWVRFCLVAHYQQAITLKKRNAQIGQVWEAIDQITKKLKINERVQLALMDAAFGYKVRNLRHRTENEISEVVASRDLKDLCAKGLLIPVGEKRGRYYVAGEMIAGLSRRFADKSKAQNPYDLVSKRAKASQLSLPV
ncbi:Fic family protein [Mesorhizobium sp. Cs1299R1N1]|uniref:Fic family protein n=1 Tax=Mesorhizobium sp. Cs1299R1N1 TaxID=3015172 RepID=UPI00301DC5F2